MDALKRSIEENRQPAPANDAAQIKLAGKAKKAKLRIPGQTEMLLPITGGGKVQAKEEKTLAVKPRRKAG